MFIVLKDMKDEKACRVFMLLHIPLYAVILALLFSEYHLVGAYITDIFLVGHLLVHLGFRKHPTNQLNGGFSRGLIYLAGLLAAIHLVSVSVWQSLGA